MVLLATFGADLPTLGTPLRGVFLITPSTCVSPGFLLFSLRHFLRFSCAVITDPVDVPLLLVRVFRGYVLPFRDFRCLTHLYNTLHRQVGLLQQALSQFLVRNSRHDLVSYYRAGQAPKLA